MQHRTLTLVASVICGLSGGTFVVLAFAVTPDPWFLKNVLFAFGMVIWGLGAALWTVHEET